MRRFPLQRPTLLPGLARFWRDRHTLQLGLDPARAVLLEVADPRLVELLELLDGGHSERAVLDRAVTAELPREQARALLDALREAGVLVGGHTLLPGNLPEPLRRRLGAEVSALALRRDQLPGTPAQVLRRRAGARVVVAGRGRLGAPLAVALAQAGVGHVSPELAGRVLPGETVGSGLVATDVQRPRAAAVAEAIARAAPGAETGPVPRGAATLTVEVNPDRPAALLAAAYARRRSAYLVVGVRDGTPIVGPFVPPRGSPCLNCLDLHRRDRDPGWPAVAAQLAGADPFDACDAATLLASVGYAVAEVLACVDGSTPETLGGATEISAPGRLRRRSWPPHPGCGCGRRGR